MKHCTNGCDASCNSTCGCGDTHHHCGCPCHAEPPSLDEQHQHAERQATKWLAEYQRLSAEVGRVPGDIEPPKWTCVVCHLTHPADHAGLFCGVCKIMAACCSCERTFAGQCHGEWPSLGLTPAEWSALFETRRLFEDRGDVPLTEFERTAAASAIAKITDAAYRSISSRNGAGK